MKNKSLLTKVLLVAVLAASFVFCGGGKDKTEKPTTGSDTKIEFQN